MFGRTGANSWPSTSSILLWDLNTQLARKITGRVLFQACDRRSNLHFIFENVMIGLFYVCGNYYISPYDNMVNTGRKSGSHMLGSQRSNLVH